MVTLVIKNPARPEGFVLEDVPFSSSLAYVQDLISKTYPGNPAPSDQTLIYAGKVLKDNSITIQQLVAKLEPDGAGPFNFHLVIKQSQGSTSRAPAPAVSQPAAPAIPAPNSADAQPADAQPSSTVDDSVPTQNAQAPAQGQQGGAQPEQQADIPPTASSWGQGLPPYMYLNPIVATAYQAAYTAALAAGACAQQQHHQQQQQQQQEANPSDAAGTSSSPAEGQAAASTSAASIPGLSPTVSGAAATMTALRSMSPAWPMHSVAYTQAYLASMNVMAAMGAAGGLPPQDLQQHQRIVQLLMGGQGLMHYPPQLMLNPPSQQLLNMLLQQQGMPSITLSANGETLVVQGQPAANNPGARNRRNAAAAAAMVQAAAVHRPHRPRRQRVFTLRINMRTLLQLLVFGMVLYQHFTWRRLVLLLCLAAALWLTSLAPLRRLVAGLQLPAQAARPAAAEAPANPAAQPAAGAAGAPAAAGAAPAVAVPAAAPGNNNVAPAANIRGVLKEIAVVVVGFMTSLLPAWNYNPDDAAAFAAAQEGIPPAAPQQQRAAEGNNAAAVAAEGAQPPPDAAAAAAAGAAAAAQEGGPQHEHQD